MENNLELNNIELDNTGVNTPDTVGVDANTPVSYTHLTLPTNSRV